MQAVLDRLTSRWLLAGIVTLAGFALLATNLGGQLFVDLTIAGLTLGSIAALSGLGVVVTYKATGVFNFAHGAMAVFVAYVLWQLGPDWGLPLILAAPLALLVVGPGLGVLLDRLVFRPLAERDASTAENLVATVGLFVVLLGLVVAVWGPGLKTNPATLFPSGSVCLGCGSEGLSFRIGTDQLGVIGVLIVASVALYFLFNRSRLGLDIKAVVDRRELAQLTAVDANRVSAIAWAIGAGFAGITGVLLAPVATGSLDPFRLTLLVLETFAVAVVARLRSLPVAIAAGLGIGLATSYLTTFSFGYLVNWFSDDLAATVAQAIDQIIPSFPVFLLFAVLVFSRGLSLGSDESSGSFVARISNAGSGLGSRSTNAVTVLIIAVILFALPFAIQGDISLFRNTHRMLALAVVFLSIVIVTGFSGHITLAQAGFAGLGALVAARAHNAGLPVILSMLIGGLVCIPIGLGAGYPALKRRGLFLGLTTLALSLVLERGVLQNLFLVGGAGATTFDAPSIFGLSLGSDIAFYFYELVVLVLMILLARNLHRGQLGRVLGAMRDSERGARSIALNLRTYKLFIFAVSAFMAGIGGALLGQASGTYSGEDFLTINSLLWFAVVVVAGVGSIYGALVGAFLFTLLGALLPQQGMATLLIGLAAVSMGRLPGGIVGTIKQIAGGGGPVPDELTAPDGGREMDRPPRDELRPTPLAKERLTAAAGSRGEQS